MQINELDTVNDYLFYNPKCFILLQQWLDFLKSMWDRNELNINPPKPQKLLELYDFLNCQIVFEKSQNQITSEHRWTQFVHQWFDAFKTLKTIHYFDKNLLRLNLNQLLNTSNFAKVTDSKLQTFINNNDKN